MASYGVNKDVPTMTVPYATKEEVNIQHNNTMADINRKLNGIERRTKNHFRRLDDKVENLESMDDDIAAEVNNLCDVIDKNAEEAELAMAEIDASINQSINEVNNMVVESQNDLRKWTQALMVGVVLDFILSMASLLINLL